MLHRRHRALGVALLGCLSPNAGLGLETMRIAMASPSPEVRLEAPGLAFGEDLEDTAFSSLPSGRVALRVNGGRLSLNGATLPASAVRFRSAPEPIHVGGLVLRGDVVVRLSRGALQLVNVIPLEDYVVGVLGSEMPKSFPPEALKAQAVAARTYALRKKLEAYGQPFHLGSGVLSQVYGGLRGEEPRVRAAVEATRGLVLTYELSPIEAYFHASCGGRTERGVDALGRDLPYLVSVDCPCGELVSSQWSATLDRRELERAFGGLGRGTPLSVVSRTRTGRARRVELGVRSIDAVTFREKLGYSRVKSLGFEVASQGERLLLSGKGHGHGAGLCQWGAKVRAEEGWDFRRILEHYYPGTELQVLY